MAIKAKYGANEALKVIDGELTRELSIHRFDEKHEPRCICLPPMALWASNLPLFSAIPMCVLDIIQPNKLEFFWSAAQCLTWMVLSLC